MGKAGSGRSQPSQRRTGGVGGAYERSGHSPVHDPGFVPDDLSVGVLVRLQGASSGCAAHGPPKPQPARAPAPLPHPDPHRDIRLEIERVRLEADRLDALSSLEFRRGLDAYVRGDDRAPAPLSRLPVPVSTKSEFGEAWEEIEQIEFRSRGYGCLQQITASILIILIPPRRTWPMRLRGS